MDFKKYHVGFVCFFCIGLLLLPGGIRAGDEIPITINRSIPTDDEIPITTQRLSPRVLVLSETVMGNNVTAVASDMGIVVFDTTGLPSTAAKMRRIIEQEFGRTDFAYVINTHSHWDHSFGNQVFPEAVIIGHDSVPPGMTRDKDMIPRQLENMERIKAEQTARLQDVVKDSEEAQNIQRSLGDIERQIRDFRDVFVSTPPDITFSDRMTLDLGDVTLELDYFGRAHSTGDIFIRIPEEKLVLTGDLFLDQRWVPLFAGQPLLDIDRWLDVLERTLDGTNPAQKVIPGHMDLWDAEKLDLWRDYIAFLWDGVKAAKEKGLSLEQARSELPLPERCLYLKERGHDDERIRRFHEGNLEAFWRQLFVSAAQAIEEVLREPGWQRIPASEKLFEKMTKEQDVYRIDESELNSLGYRLLERNDIWAALTVFHFNVETFPQSYNVYDSLAEAYMNGGDKYYAKTYYRKSLELNPDNQNARDRLARIDEFFEEHHSPNLKNALFAPGAKTGLKGPYLGQTPPGLKAEKFAPGIVSTEGGFEFSCTFSADGREFYFNRGMTIMVCRWEEDGWTAPEPASFNGDYRNHEPHITADNQTLYFGSMRPNPDRPDMRRPNGIWKVERSEDGWGPASYAGYGMYVTTTAGGVVYVTDVDSEDAMQHGIARAEIIDGRFGPLVRQTGSVAQPEPGRRAGRHPCISPDENFIIFDSYTLEHPGWDGHLYICFREKNGSWGQAVDLSKIFGTEGDIAASLSPDGRCLFFSTDRDIYWIGMEVINRLRKNTEHPLF